MWKIVGIAVLVLAVLGLESLQAPPPASVAPAASAAVATTIDWGWWVGLIGITALVLVILIGLAAVFKRVGWSIASLDKGTLATIAALLFLEWALWKYVPAMKPMFEGPGWFFFTLTYVVAIIILASVNEHAKGMQWFFGIASMVVALTLIGTHGHPEDLWDYWPFGGGRTTVALNGGVCDEKVHLVTLSNAGQVINPNGGCFTRLHEEVPGHCVDVYDRFDRYLGNDCSGDSNLDGKYGARFAAAQRGPSRSVSATYVLCNKRGRTNLVIDGCP